MSLEPGTKPGTYEILALEEHDGSPSVVMKLVEGETLAERVSRGAVSLDEALSYFIQTAASLEAAHDRGIVPRDLKPANIETTPDGRVKLMGFGLAKAFAGEVGASTESSQSPAGYDVRTIRLPMGRRDLNTT